jgi:hypothetical protein
VVFDQFDPLARPRAVLELAFIGVERVAQGLAVVVRR